MATWQDWFDSYKPKPVGTPTAPTTAAATGGGLYPSLPNPGRGAYGGVPSGVGIPDDVTGGIKRDLSGIISPEVQAKLQNIAATWGIRSGMPGSGAQSNLYAHDYLGASDAARQRGFENWKSLVPLQQQNNELAAAPNPETRALTEQSFAKQMFDQYLAALRGGRGVGGNGGGGYRSPAGGTMAMPSAPATPDTRNPAGGRLPTSPGVLPATDNWGGLNPSQQSQYNDALNLGALWSARNDPNGDIFGGSYPDAAPPPSVGQGDLASNPQLDPYNEYWDSIFNN